ncbi:MAG: hypothetical protein IPI65_02630 [Bacteroidetes bacterium]|nr:hypothetical protein [Bacteroidota bacterium]
MTTPKNILLLLILLIFTECTVSTDKFPEPEKLRREIVNSIEIPFTVGDTIIYESFLGICGNSSKDELNRYYEPNLNEQPYFDILKLKTQKTTLCTGDSLSALMDRICKNNTDSLSVWDCFSKNKIVLSITGEAVTNNAVKIYENYSYNNDHVFIEKLFEYTNDKWTSKIVESREDNGND